MPFTTLLERRNENPGRISPWSLSRPVRCDTNAADERRSEQHSFRLVFILTYILIIFGQRAILVELLTVVNKYFQCLLKMFTNRFF